MSNISKEITYRRRLNDSYEVIFLEEGELALHEMEMLRRNQLSSFLPIEFMIEDGVSQFWFRITGLQSMETLIKTGRFGKECLQTFMKGLENATIDTERFLLRENQINLAQIYFSMDGARVYFTYYPVYEDVEEVPLKTQILEILDNLVKEADYTDKEYVSYLFKVYESLSMENGSIRNLTIEDRAENLIVVDEEDMLENEREKEEEIEREKVLSMDMEKLQEDSIFTKLKSKIHKAAVDKVKDEVWNVKKTARRYADFRNISFGDTEYVNPSQVREHPTQYLGEDGCRVKDVGTGKKTEASLEVRGLEPREVSLEKERVILGKKEGYADVVLKDPTVSRMHAMIERREDGYFLEDLNSLNGTYVNGKPMELKKQLILTDLDEILMGNTSMVFHC